MTPKYAVKSNVSDVRQYKIKLSDIILNMAMSNPVGRSYLKPPLTQERQWRTLIFVFPWQARRV